MEWMHLFISNSEQWLPFCLSVMHLSMLSRWGGGRPGKGGGFDSNHRPLLGFFDRFNGLSSNILLTLVAILTIHNALGWGI